MNKIVAYYNDTDEKWWAVIDCGQAKQGGMATPVSFNFVSFEHNGKAYRYFRPIHNPPPDLVNFQEIHIKAETMWVVCSAQDKAEAEYFSGFDDSEDLFYQTLIHYTENILGIEITKEEIIKKIQEAERSELPI